MENDTKDRQAQARVTDMRGHAMVMQLSDRGGQTAVHRFISVCFPAKKCVVSRQKYMTGWLHAHGCF